MTAAEESVAKALQLAGVDLVTGIARVAIDTPADDCFDYLAGADIGPGELVVVPFGKRQVMGVVIERPSETSVPADRVRPVAGHLGWMPPLSAQWIALARFAARYYHRCLGEVMLPALPPSLRDPQTWERLEQRARTTQYRVRPAQSEVMLAAIPARARTVRALAEAIVTAPDGLRMSEARELCTAAPARLAEWEAAGWITSTHADRPLLEIA
ncbi:MAG: hypothetical protein JO278_13515, partial [Dyella sp.]|nr:hypothetical protein [Dyella sp.]